MSTSAPTAKPAPRLPFGAQVLLGMGIGLALGFAGRAIDGASGAVLGEALHTTGQIFVQLLKALVPRLCSPRSWLRSPRCVIWRMPPNSSSRPCCGSR